MPTWLPSSLPSCRHLKEISELQSQQKQEIEALYRRLGKPLPPNLGLFHTAPPVGRRRRSSKSKLKAGKLLNPLVQQLKVVASSTGWPRALLAALMRGSRAGGRQARGPEKALLESPCTGAGKPFQAWESSGLCPSCREGRTEGQAFAESSATCGCSVLLLAECCLGWRLLPLTPFLRHMSPLTEGVEQLPWLGGEDGKAPPPLAFNRSAQALRVHPDPKPPHSGVGTQGAEIPKCAR